jgi:hypothetical protein
MEDFNGWHACFLARITTLRLYVIGQVQVMVWIGPSFVHGSDVSRLYVDGDIFACIWIELYVHLGSSRALVRMGALFFNESSILRCLACRVKHFLGAIFFYLASVVLRVRWIDSVAVGCFEWLSDATEAGDVVVSMAVNVFHG